jgi:hypothetical protein
MALRLSIALAVFLAILLAVQELRHREHAEVIERSFEEICGAVVDHNNKAVSEDREKDDLWKAEYECDHRPEP